jgi:hypothetical protein
MSRRAHRHSGFTRAASLLDDQIRKGTESRGFTVSRLLTHWADIAGADLAAMAHPVDVSYGRKAFGATLTVLTTGAQAPLLEMQKEVLRQRVNTVYGYNAIGRIRITQTAPAGFAEMQAAFSGKPADRSDPAAEAAAAAAAQAARAATARIGDTDLRAALEALGRNVLSRSNT